ncbi:lantibiotic dehydratase [Streptomyces sp. A1-5]|nr:lantibiotic dehydratase [Streptomyces sp. A1-5]
MRDGGSGTRRGPPAAPGRRPWGAVPAVRRGPVRRGPAAPEDSRTRRRSTAHGGGGPGRRGPGGGGRPRRRGGAAQAQVPASDRALADQVPLADVPPTHAFRPLRGGRPRRVRLSARARADRRRTPRDPAWLDGVVETLLDVPAVLEGSRLTANNLHVVRDGRLVLVDDHDRDGERQLAGSVRHTRVVRQLLAAAARPTAHPRLVEAARREFPHAPPGAIEGSIRQLVRGHFLLGDLTPPPDCTATRSPPSIRASATAARASCTSSVGWPPPAGRRSCGRRRMPSPGTRGGLRRPNSLRLSPGSAALRHVAAGTAPGPPPGAAGRRRRHRPRPGRLRRRPPRSRDRGHRRLGRGVPHELKRPPPRRPGTTTRPNGPGLFRGVGARQDLGPGGPTPMISLGVDFFRRPA